ncbi:MAG: glycosyltransferase 87 family protein [Deltaproteobacteria bacterium]|nr:glycosyltransferase 87 family protein [Deltaproteobacteria bacterium]
MAGRGGVDAALAWLRRGWPVLLVAMLAVHLIAVVLRRAAHPGDFDISRELGRRLLAGEPLYAGGLHYPYMPTAALWFAPLALLPPWLGFALRYAAAIGALWLVLRWCASLAAVEVGRRVLVGALTLGLGAHYVWRDLDDSGPHLILLALLIGGLLAAQRGRTAGAAALFGLAAALKAPNALLLPFLLWKRQWHLAALSLAALVAWTALPALVMGPASWWAQQRQWAATALASAVGAPQPGPRASEARVQNQSLRRLLSAASPRGAAIVPAAAIALLAALAWWTRRRPAMPGDAARWLAELAALLIAALLLSPVTWVQHCVLALPALYVVVARADALRWPAPVVAALSLFAVLALLLNRELLGREWYLALLAVGLHTLALLVLLGLLIATAPRASDGAS